MSRGGARKGSKKVLSRIQIKYWSKCLNGELYDPDAFDAAIEWLDDAYAFIELLANTGGTLLGFHEAARALLARAKTEVNK